MLSIVSGDLLTLPQHYIKVVTVNCVGVLGAGIAKQFAAIEPHAAARYRHICATGKLRPGNVIFETGNEGSYYLAATKDHWRNPSQLAWVESAMLAIRRHVHNSPISQVPIAMPPLGAGLGGLNGLDVLNIARSIFTNDPRIHVYYHLPE